jgi:hypothetical protein
MRGGKRKGSGRKKSPDSKMQYSTRLRPDLIEWLKNRNAAREIEAALDDRIKSFLK